jgi:antitoxin VapB
MPVLNIKDPEAHDLAAEIARRTGESLTTVVKQALRERLARERSSGRSSARLVERALELGRRISSRPILDPRTPEEILGYDDSGVPR